MPFPLIHWLSIVIHPDKATHPKAQDAFDLLKKVPQCLVDVVSTADLFPLRQRATCPTRTSVKISMAR